MRCKLCGEEKEITEILGVCMDCLRNIPTETFPYMDLAHKRAREKFNLPEKPPRSQGGIQCKVCSNKCILADGEVGYCGIKKNSGGRLIPDTEYALAQLYINPLPTNCCASWFCQGNKEQGKNIAVFFYGCNLDCLFCQNPVHKEIDNAPKITLDDFVSQVVNNKEIRCICFFGGSPEPQLPFAINASEEIMKERTDIRICWESNGNGDEDLMLKAAKISLESGGTMKMDIKAFNPNLSKALCGIYDEQTYTNFKLIADKLFGEREDPVLTATTPLIAGYIDAIEVERIAKFIAGINPDIPYSLLAYKPGLFMEDIPATSKELADECCQVAKKYLNRVHIDACHLIEE